MSSSTFWKPRLTLLGLMLAPVVLAAAESKIVKIRAVDASTGDSVHGFTVSPGGSADDGAVRADDNGEVDFPVRKERNAVVIAVGHPDYIPVHVMWRRQAGESVVSVPDEHTVKLPRGIKVGGVVMDATGQPVTEAKIHFTSSYNYRKSPGVVASWGRTFSVLNPTNTPSVTTDSGGRWSFDRFPTNLDSSPGIVVQRRNGALTTFVTAQPSFVFPNRPPPRALAPAKLAAQQAELTIPEGRTLRVRVLGPDGKPLVGAVLFEKPNRNALANYRRPVDASGVIVLSNRPPENICLEAAAPGYVTAVAIAQRVDEDEELKLQLRRARTLEIRVLGDDGRPLPGVALSLRDQQHLRLPTDAQTDAKGTYVWDSAPSSPVRFWLTHPELGRRVLATDGVRNPEFMHFKRHNSEKALVAVRAVDDSNGRPVPEFVVRGRTYGTPKEIMSFAGQNGSASGEVRKVAWPNGTYPNLEVSVEASGFAPAVIGSLDFYEGDHEFQARLKPLSEVSHVAVRTPDGKPAAKAEVFVLKRGGRVFLSSHRIGSNSSSVRKTKADADGRYRLVGLHDASRLVITHDSGMAEIEKDDFIQRKEIRLRAWSRVEGTAREAGKLLRNQTIRLGTPQLLDPNAGMYVSLSTRSDESGRFVFERAPPGDLFLSRSPGERRVGTIVHSHPLMISALAGETLRLDYGGKGRVVTGTLETSPPGVDIDWRWDRQTMVRRVDHPPQPTFNDYATNEEFAAAQKKFFASPERRAALEKDRTYQLNIDKFGNFRVADVEPGNYRLNIRLTEPRTGTQRRISPHLSGKQLGSYSAKVIVPEGPDGVSVNLGVHTVEITGNAAKRTKAPELTFRGLDGREWRLAEHRGKTVVLVFVAEWCLSSQAALKPLAQMHQTHSGRDDSELIGISLDDSLEAAQAWKVRDELGWLHGWADPASQLDLLQSIDLRGTPSVYVIASDGTLLGRDVNVPELEGYLKKAASLRRAAAR